MDTNQAGNDGANDGANVGSTGAEGQALEQAQKPTVFDLSDENALIKIKGSDKPVKFGEHVKGFQSQFTKASQEASRLKAELAQEKARYQQIEAQRQAHQQGQNGQQTDPLADLASQPYLTGEVAANAFRSFGQAIQQRDQVLLGALKQLQEVKQIVQGLNQTSTMSGFDAKINKWLSDGGYPVEAADLAKEIYLAYEGDDLDEQFPSIFAERWGQVEKMIEAKKSAAINANRKNRFVPGKGGQVGPSKPLQLDPRASAADVANTLWESLQGQDT